MVSESVHGRYAQVLFTVASKNNKLSIIHSDLQTISKYFKNSQNLKNFIADKTFDKTQQKEVLSTITKDSDELTNNFIDTVLENRKLYLFEKMINCYDEFMKLQNKEESIKVVSAAELGKDEKKRLAESLGKKLGHSNFTVVYESDASILGGLQVYFGNTFLDCSLLTRLNKVQGEVRNLGA